MKKYFYILAALSMVPNLSLAQGANFDAEVDQELDQMYKDAAAKNSAASAGSAAPVAAGISSTAPVSGGSQPIYILNQATPTSNAQAQATQVQKQPVAVIESTPLVESRAEMMRKSRQDAEIQTEQKIVEKLEQSRLEDEKRRADALFGNKLNQVPAAPVEQTAPVVATPVVITPVTPVAPAAPVPAPTPQENMRDIVREELTAVMKVEEEPAPVETKYFSGIIGIADYQDVKNVESNYSLGVAFGTKFDQMILEGSFILSNYDVITQSYLYSGVLVENVETNQYQGAVAAKYQLMSGMFRPVVGGVVAYSYRQYNWQDAWAGGVYYPAQTTTSHAIDLGATAGVDLEFSKKFALGLEYKYMFNLSSRRDGNAVYTGPQYGTPLEKLSYYMLTMAAKVTF